MFYEFELTPARSIAPAIYTDFLEEGERRVIIRGTLSFSWWPQLPGAEET